MISLATFCVTHISSSEVPSLSLSSTMDTVSSPRATASSSSSSSSSTGHAAIGPSGTTQRQSCDRCHKQKLRCIRSKSSEGGVCDRCLSKRAQCVYSFSLPKGRPSLQRLAEESNSSANNNNNTESPSATTTRSRPKSRTTSLTSGSAKNSAACCKLALSLSLSEVAISIHLLFCLILLANNAQQPRPSDFVQTNMSIDSPPDSSNRSNSSRVRIRRRHGSGSKHGGEPTSG